MIFCDKCGSVMLPKGKMLACSRCRCKKMLNKHEEAYKVKEEVEHKPEEEVYVEQDTEKDSLPQTTAECPECGNKKAMYWFEQTRSLDEPATRFFRCIKCKFTWREYS